MPAIFLTIPAFLLTMRAFFLTMSAFFLTISALFLTISAFFLTMSAIFLTMRALSPTMRGHGKPSRKAGKNHNGSGKEKKIPDSGSGCVVRCNYPIRIRTIRFVFGIILNRSSRRLPTIQITRLPLASIQAFSFSGMENFSSIKKSLSFFKPVMPRG